MPGRACKVKEQSPIMCYEVRNHLSALPPAVMIHGLAQLRAALAPQQPVTLLSAPGAASAWGCLWWQSLLAACAYAGPALLDCGQAPGRAIEALRLGIKGVVLAPNPAWADVSSLARQKQALLLSAPPVSLDLGQIQAERRLMAWLSA